MPRRIIYGISLWVFLGAAACSIAAVALPNWVSFTSPTSDDPIKLTYGLHRRCSSISGGCEPFPKDEDCRGEDRYFCSVWRSTGFFMNLSLVFELACVIAYITILFGGRQSRESGWKMLSGLLAVVAAGQLVSMVMTAYLFEHDNRFFVGWRLDTSWILCTVSWAVMLLDALGIAAAAFVMPKEDDYEPIPEPR